MASSPGLRWRPAKFLANDPPLRYTLRLTPEIEMAALRSVLPHMESLPAKLCCACYPRQIPSATRISSIIHRHTHLRTLENRHSQRCAVSQSKLDESSEGQPFSRPFILWCDRFQPMQPYLPTKTWSQQKRYRGISVIGAYPAPYRSAVFLWPTLTRRVWSSSDSG